MALLPLDIKAGVYKNGTDLQAMGRWNDANLVRWHDNSMKPVGGWRNRTGRAWDNPIRGMIAWVSNSGSRYMAVGTYQHLFAVTANNIVYDITPNPFTTGRLSAAGMTGYGSGFYGSGIYNAPPVNTSSQLQDATSWTLSTFGETLIANSPDDGKVYQWSLSSSSIATQVANSPTDVVAICVSDERFLWAFKRREIFWSDQENITVWNSLATNQAGNISLETQGTIKCAEKIRGGIIILTDQDAHTAKYIGQPFVHSVQRVGSNCGVYSSQASVELDLGVVWMGKSGFHLFAGGRVQELKCDVSDHVFDRINENQKSKVTAIANAKFDEVIWFYPSTTDENDSYVSWNYKQNTWSIGNLGRTSGIDAGVFTHPIYATSLYYENNLTRNKFSLKIDTSSGNLDANVQDVGMFVTQRHDITGYGSGTFGGYLPFNVGNNTLSLLDTNSVGEKALGHLAVPASGTTYESIVFPNQKLKYRVSGVHGVGSGFLYQVTIVGLDDNGISQNEVIEIRGDGTFTNSVTFYETAKSFTKVTAVNVLRLLNSYAGINFGLGLNNISDSLTSMSTGEIKGSFLGLRAGGTNPSTTTNKIVEVEADPNRPSFLTGGIVKLVTNASDVAHNTGANVNQSLGTFNKAILNRSEYMLVEHEVGELRDNATPFAQSGPVQIGNGDQIMHINQVIPDEKIQGQVNLEFKTRFYPNGTETSHGSFTLQNPTSVRLQGREIRMKVNNVSGDWRVGTMRVNAVAGGKR